jgi:hypothetical protein
MRATDNDHFVLDSGRVFYAHQGVIGLGPDPNNIYDGYDGNIYGEFGQSADALSPSERIEIADYMIARWSAYKARLNG